MSPMRLNTTVWWNQLLLLMGLFNEKQYSGVWIPCELYEFAFTFRESIKQMGTVERRPSIPAWFVAVEECCFALTPKFLRPGCCGLSKRPSISSEKNRIVLFWQKHSGLSTRPGQTYLITAMVLVLPRCSQAYGGSPGGKYGKNSPESAQTWTWLNPLLWSLALFVSIGIVQWNSVIVHEAALLGRAWRAGHIWHSFLQVALLRNHRD